MKTSILLSCLYSEYIAGASSQFTEEWKQAQRQQSPPSNPSSKAHHSKHSVSKKTTTLCSFLLSPSRQEFVNAYVDYVFNTSVAPLFECFYAGFHKVCGGKVLELFQPNELQAMVIGNTNYDWTELQKVLFQIAINGRKKKIILDL